MIIEFFLQLILSLLSSIFSSAQFVDIPYQLIEVLGTFLAYGNWIVGSDLLVIIALTVVFWTTVKIAWGGLVYLWLLIKP